MAGFRIPGPLTGEHRLHQPDAGTSAITRHAPPGPLLDHAPSPFGVDYTDAQLDQLWLTRKADILLSAGRLARQRIAGEVYRLTGEALQDVLHGLLPGLLMGVGALLLTTSLGAALGGVLGFFFGGVGAAPGAVAGASLGLDAGMALMTFLGLAFMADAVVTGAAQVRRTALDGVRRAFNSHFVAPQYEHAELDRAATLLARAVAELVLVLLTAVVAWLTRGQVAGAAGRLGANAAQTTSALRAGEGLALAETRVAELVGQLRRSKLGDGFADYIECNWKRLCENPRLAPRRPPAAAATTGGGAASTPAQLKGGGEPPAKQPPEPPPRKPDPKEPRPSDEPCPLFFAPGGGGAAAAGQLGSGNAARVAGAQMAHPVDMATGRKLLLPDTETDATVPAGLPIDIARFYASPRSLDAEADATALGPGWRLPWELRLQRHAGGLRLTDGFGRRHAFPALAPGERHFHPTEQRWLARDAQGRHALIDLDGLRHDFAPLADRPDTSAGIERISDSAGQWQRFERDASGRVIRIHASGDVTLALEHEPIHGRLAAIHPLPPAKADAAAEAPAALPLVRYGYDAAGRLASVTDADGLARRRFAYDARGLMTRHETAAGFACSYTWTVEGNTPRVASCATSEGAHWQFTHDPANHQAWAEDDLGRRAHWVFNPARRVVACTDLDGAQYRIDWNAQGLPAQLHLPGDRRARFDYDALGRLVRETDPLARSRTLAYDGDSPRIARATGTDGATSEARHDALGRLVALRDPLGRETLYDYATTTPWPAAITDAAGRRKQLAWSPRGELLAYTDCSGKTTRQTFDALGRRIAITNALGQTTRIERAAAGQPLRITHADGSTETFTYALGQLTEHHRAQRPPRRWTRNPRGQIRQAIDEAGRALTYRHDSHGRLVALANAAGGEYHFAWDAADRLTQEQRPDGTERRFGYDAAGFLASLDTLGAPDPGSPDADALARDPALRPARRVAFERDALGRLRASTSATDRSSYAWDHADRLVIARRDPTAAGHALGVQPSELRFDYDAAGRLLAEHGPDGSLRATLDDLDNLTTLTLPDGQQLTTLYYGPGHAHRISLGDQLIADFERDDLHREVRRSAGALGVTTAYDALGRTTEQRSSHPRLWRRFEYEAAGDLASTDDGLRGPTRYHHDPAGQLLERANADGSVERFAWDAAGNLLDDVSRASTGRIEGNRLKVWQDLRFSYDAFGRLATKQRGGSRSERFVFDARDQLVEVRRERGDGRVVIARFAYDALGRRIATEDRIEDAQGTVLRARGKRFVWQGLRMAQEIGEGATTTYVYSPDSAYVPIARVDSPAAAPNDAARAQADAAIRRAQASSRVLHFHGDAIGTPLELTDEAGALAWVGRIKAWGRLEGVAAEPGTTPVDQPLRFQGQYAEDGAGLHYNTFRFYDPEVGRFISPDPIGIAGGENLYAYAPNPTGWVDPWGWSCNQASKGRYLFRGDARPPETIFAEGFTPQGANSDLYRYALMNEPSVFVSTSISPNVAREFSEMQGGGYVYSIKEQASGIDVNAILGAKSPFPEEMEVAVPYGIKSTDILGAREVTPDGKFSGPFIKNPLFGGGM